MTKVAISSVYWVRYIVSFGTTIWFNKNSLELTKRDMNDIADEEKTLSTTREYLQGQLRVIHLNRDIQAIYDSAEGLNATWGI
jgi:hypothetical protein